MGGSISSASLYRTVAIVEIITSLVITIFGANTLLLFQQQNDEFQSGKEMILYASIVAVVQSVLTILSSILLVGCHRGPLPPPPPIHHESQWVGDENGEQQRLPPPPPLPTSSQIGRHDSLRRKAVGPTWISWALISIACLLFVFISPIHYCIQGPSDIDKLNQLTMRDGYYETLDNKRLGLCFSDAKELQPIRNSLRDLYSFSFISIMFKVLFVLMVQRNWKREQERAKKVIVYVERCSGTSDAGDMSPTEPKIIVSSCSAGNIGDIGGRGGDTGDSGKGKAGAEMDDVKEKIKK